MIAVKDFGQRALGTGQFDQVAFDVRLPVKSLQQSCPQIFCAAQYKGNGTGRENGDFHVAASVRRATTCCQLKPACS